MNALDITLRPAVYYICIAGQLPNAWAIRDGMIPQADLAVLPLGLAELAHHYGYIKLPA